MKLNKTITFNNVNITKFTICAKKTIYNAVDIYTTVDLFCNTGFLRAISHWRWNIVYLLRFWTGDISDVNTRSHKKTVIICLYHACSWVINIILSKGQRGKFTNHLTICATSSNFNSLYKALTLSDKSPDCFVSPVYHTAFQNCTVSDTVSLL